ncbi:hypothetical protein EUX98_g8259 [Antrodiella citrinella]|uniref:Uncharacterized protein n=1 Tax=Antrodiella citrinella TaxID=2447956 RepID=A0A4S4M9B6_9APHY|nr:hypothetical protein EUX98_g8259 [Antrodiella citrinella]
MASTNAEKFCAITKSLGGPDIAPADIEWANDIPAGRDLLKWIADQLYDTDVSATDSPFIPALHSIALEHEEVKLYEEAVEDDGITGVDEAPVNLFKVPSVQKASNERTLQELALLEGETARLKSRLQQMKTASRHLLQTRHTLQAAVKESANSIRTHQESLDNLAVKADASISKAVSEAHSLLDKTMRDSESLDTYRTSLAILEDKRNAIISAAKDRLRSIDEVQHSLPDTSYVNDESARLSKALKDLDFNARRDDLIELAVEEDLLAICEKLETSGDGTTLDDILGDMTHDLDDEASIFKTEDIGPALEKAWRSDQLALLAAREKVLDEAQAAFGGQIHEQLTQLQKHLSSVANSNFEAEALVSALLEEIEDAISDAEDAKTSFANHSSNAKDVERDPHINKLRAVLKDLREYRPSDAPPLILLEDADLDAELASTSRRLIEAQAVEEEWLRSLTSQL